MRRRKKIKALTVAVISCISLVILYTITAIVIQYKTGIALDSSLTVGVFGLFGTELAVSGFIKIFKLKEENNNEYH